MKAVKYVDYHNTEREKKALAQYLTISNLGLFSENDMRDVLGQSESWLMVNDWLFGELQSRAESDEMWDAFCAELKYWEREVKLDIFTGEGFWVLEWAVLCEKTGVVSGLFDEVTGNL